MILTGPEISRQVKAGAITIDPFDERLLNPNSYNYRLGPTLRVQSSDELDTRREPDTRRIELDPEDGYLLLPEHLYLGHTIERMGSDWFVPSLIGRSSLGRLGLWLQVTADLGNLGNVGSWTLELKVVQPLRVYPGARIGQVTFWQPAGEIGDPYRGKYWNHSTVHDSKIEEELDDPDRF